MVSIPVLLDVGRIPKKEKKRKKKYPRFKKKRSRQELANESLIAKIGVDTAENEPSKVSMKEGTRSGVASIVR